MVVICAWCHPQHEGEEGKEVSHGICKRHRMQMEGSMYEPDDRASYVHLRVNGRGWCSSISAGKLADCLELLGLGQWSVEAGCIASAMAQDNSMIPYGEEREVVK